MDWNSGKEISSHYHYSTDESTGDGKHHDLSTIQEMKGESGSYHSQFNSFGSQSEMQAGQQNNPFSSDMFVHWGDPPPAIKHTTSQQQQQQPQSNDNSYSFIGGHARSPQNFLQSSTPRLDTQWQPASQDQATLFGIPHQASTSYNPMMAPYELSAQDHLHYSSPPISPQDKPAQPRIDSLWQRRLASMQDQVENQHELYGQSPDLDRSTEHAIANMSSLPTCNRVQTSTSYVNSTLVSGMPMAPSETSYDRRRNLETINITSTVPLQSLHRSSSTARPKRVASSSTAPTESLLKRRSYSLSTANSPSTSTSLDKGTINKVIVHKASSGDRDGTQTESSHVAETRHLCPYPGCNKHFSTSGHARRHSRNHASLRPFECPHEGCGATFTRRDNCTQHQRARHRSQLVAHRLPDPSSQ